MKPWKRRLCEIIFKLDKIPRYGRIATLPNDLDDLDNIQWRWEYQRYGMWGFYLLDDIGWLHEYIDWQLSQRQLTRKRHNDEES